jgi:hypothetical protein
MWRVPAYVASASAAGYRHRRSGYGSLCGGKREARERQGAYKRICIVQDSTGHGLSQKAGGAVISRAVERAARRVCGAEWRR